MAKLLEFEDENGVVVTIAAREPGDIVDPVGLSDRARKKIEKALDDVLALTGSVATSFKEALRGAPVESGQIEFGLQFTVGGSVYVIDSSAGATLTVRLDVRPDG